MDFSGQVAIVTGGSRGVGRAVVLDLVQRGARVLFGYHTRADAAEETLAAVRACGGEAQALAGDVAEAATATALVGQALAQWGQVDVLVNCAGWAAYGPLEAMSSAQWRRTLAVNLTGTYYTCRAALRPMMQRRYGRIVNLSALHGRGGFPGQADYSAATGGVLGMTRATAREVAAWNITVNAVAPGLVDTELVTAVPADVLAWSEQIIAMRRAGRPEEIASAVVFLASPLASYITGHTLAVDGGWTMC
jgi:3-oxoacyl-[acyl-carrier protein] reductase